MKSRLIVTVCIRFNHTSVPCVPPTVLLSIDDGLVNGGRKLSSLVSSHPKLHTDVPELMLHAEVGGRA